jgi:multicomponent Na+:H+ antiporter subunit E
MAMALTWMFLKGAVTLQSFLEGLFFAVLTVFTTRAIIKPEFRQTFPRVLRRIPPYLRYLAFFVRAVVHGNVDVAFRSLHPRLPIYPGILAVNIEGMSDLEIAMMANTITLTPGTLTLDVDPDRGLMFVHTINARDLEGVRQEIKKVERHVRRVLR